VSQYVAQSNTEQTGDRVQLADTTVHTRTPLDPGQHVRRHVPHVSQVRHLYPLGDSYVPQGIAHIRQDSGDVGIIDQESFRLHFACGRNTFHCDTAPLCGGGVGHATEKPPHTTADADTRCQAPLGG